MSKRQSRVSFNLKERRPGPHYGSPLYDGFTAALLPPSPEPTPHPQAYPGIVPRAPHISEVQSRDEASASILHMVNRQIQRGAEDHSSIPMDLLAPARLQLAIKCASSPATTSHPMTRSSSSSLDVLISPTRHSHGPQLLTMFASASLTRPHEPATSPLQSLREPYAPPTQPDASFSQPSSSVPPPHPTIVQPAPSTSWPPSFSETTPPEDLFSPQTSRPFIPYVTSKVEPAQPPMPPIEPTFDSVRQLLSTLVLPHAPGLNLPQEPVPPPPLLSHPLLTSLYPQQPS